jgi:hypothetical protein
MSGATGHIGARLSGVRITFAQTSPGTVYKALRDDVPDPYVTLAEDGAGYEQIHADGDPSGRGGVTVIERIADEAAWHELRTQLSAHRGYLGSRLYRSEDGAVAVSRWSSPLMYARATKGVELSWQPALYLPV